MTKIAEVRFDVSALVEAYRWVATRAEPGVAQRGQDELRSISLTHRPEAVEPFYDGNQSQFDENGNKVYHEAEFSIFNSYFRDTYFHDIYQQAPFQIGRMRLMVLPPLTIYRMHVDATKRTHLAIITNPDSRLTLRSGETFHVPADGFLYTVNTKRMHTAYNSGLQERVHLTMSMADTEDQ
ncbi:aspartyl/asparaginyl beta-hydroxylase domain-containing protein [Streptomyces sp. NPDC058307]|uniref:aspartyl/asparaginyl beta-hydroxylase domain-containing protein n=1 Tax=Streptomyces sp. NPDC058307 TaxID=3346439 RepID=UPI0036EC41C6